MKQNLKTRALSSRSEKAKDEDGSRLAGWPEWQGFSEAVVLKLESPTTGLSHS